MRSRQVHVLVASQAKERRKGRENKQQTETASRERGRSTTQPDILVWICAGEVAERAMRTNDIFLQIYRIVNKPVVTCLVHYMYIVQQSAMLIFA